MKYAMSIQVPEEVWPTIEGRPDLPSDPDELWFAVQRIYAKESFGDWLDDNIAGGFADVFDEQATREDVEVVLIFKTLSELMRFQVAFNIKDATYVELQD